MCLMGTIVLVTLYYRFSYYGDLWINYIGWNTILVLLVLGKRYLNKRTGFTKYFNEASYPIYILHQSILIVLAYYIVRVCDNMVMKVFGIWGGSFILTLSAYHMVKKIPFVRKMIGMK